MAEILSQEEIDELLSALSTGEVAVEKAQHESRQRRVKKYDFRRPDKFSKEQLRTIQMVHDTFARLLSSSLSAFLRTIVEAEVVGVDQLTYDEFIRSLPNPSSTFVCNVKPLEGSVIISLDMPLSFSIIDRLLGGQGGASQVRELTDIEQTVLARILKRLFLGFKEAWKNVVELDPTLERLEMNPQFVQVVPPGDMVVLNTLELRIDDARGMMNICLPYLSLEPVLSKLSAHYWFSGTSGSRKIEKLEQLKSKLDKTVVPVSVIMGRATLNVRDVLALEVGDVIPLTSRKPGMVELEVGSRLKFLGYPGSVGRHLGVQIVKAVGETAEGDEVDESTADPSGN